MEQSFADKLIKQIKKKKSIICVGLDPRVREKNTIPLFLLENSKTKLGESSDTSPKVYNDAILEFNKGLIDATHEITPIYKPQIAFYEKYDCLEALKGTIDYIHEKGSLALLDAKRNDIGSTSDAYASSVFDHFNADAVTVNSYFGIDGVKPFLKYISKGKGVILLLKTSNPSSGEFQDLFSINLEDIPPTQSEINLSTLSGKVDPIILKRNYIHMSELLKTWSENPEYLGVSSKDEIYGNEGYSSLGGVVGATYPEQLSQIRNILPNVFILIPGYGAQGGTAKDIADGVNDDGLGAIVNNSRGINFAYQNGDYTDEEFGKAAGEAALLMRNSINDALKSSNKGDYLK